MPKSSHHRHIYQVLRHTYKLEAYRRMGAWSCYQTFPCNWRSVLSQLVLEEPEGFDQAAGYWNRLIKATSNLRWRQPGRLVTHNGAKRI